MYSASGDWPHFKSQQFYSTPMSCREYILLIFAGAHTTAKHVSIHWHPKCNPTYNFRFTFTLPPVSFWLEMCKSICGSTPHLAGVDANMDRGSIGLLSLNTLDVDDILLPVDLHHFANLLAFVVSTDNLFVKNTNKASQTNTYTFKCEIVKFSNAKYNTWTSSSLRMGMDLTLYFWRSSLDRGEDMIFLLMCEGALKCLLRFLRREDVTNGFSFMMLQKQTKIKVTNPVTLHCQATELAFTWQTFS